MNKQNIYIALEDVRSAYNIGALMRTCNFYGVFNFILVGYSGNYLTPAGNPQIHHKVLKTALGSEKDLDIQIFRETGDFLDFVQNRDLELICIEQNENSVKLNSCDPTATNKSGIVLVFGNEVRGVSDTLLQKADKIIELTRYGNHHSLNITTCAGIVLHEFTRKICN
ncbi:MAG: TrmH family RNA methyltransferase [Patescibacteria group bacterium]